MDVIASSPTPLLVGRERELDMLRQHLGNAFRGHGGLTLIGGEAGIGKTTVAEALCHEAASHGARTFAGHCYDLTETPPYGPWLEIAQQIRDLAEPFSPSTIAAMPRLESAAGQASLFAQARDFLTAATGESPVVILLEDCHWADSASLDLLRTIARVADRLRLLLLVTYRGEELGRHHLLHTIIPLLVREARAERLDLRPLDTASARALIVARYAMPGPDVARLAAYLIARSEGNALFLVELLRALEEGDMLSRDVDATWRIGALDREPVPVLVQQVIDRRLARFGDEAIALLAVAAVIGHEVSLDLWQQVAHADEETVITLVEQTAAAHLVEAWATGDGMRFRHALIRDALYAGVPALRRRRLHRQVGELLAAQPDSDPDAVAYHLQRAGDDRAVTWLVRAGERAQRAFAWPIAVARYEAALAGDERLLSPSERGWLRYRTARLLRQTDRARALDHVLDARRTADVLGDRALAAASLFTEAQLEVVRTQRAEGIEAMASAVALFDALSAQEIAQIDHQDATSTTVNLRASYTMRLAMTGRVADTLAAIERAPIADPPAAARAGDFGPSVWRAVGGGGYLSAAIAHVLTGDLVAAREAFGRFGFLQSIAGNDVNLAMPHEMPLLLVNLPYETERREERERLVAAAEVAWRRVEGASWAAGHESPRVFVDVLEGQWQDAAERLENMVSFPDWRFFSALAALGTVQRARGDHPAAWTQVRRAFPFGSPPLPGSVTLFGTLALFSLAASLSLDAGDPATARSWLEAYDRWSAWMGKQVVWGRSDGQLAWANYYRACSDLARARDCANAALTFAREPRQPLALAAAHRLLGEIETADRRRDIARAHLDHALDLVDACHARYEQALTLLSVAELEISTGREREAERALAGARTILVPLGAQPALARADMIGARRIAPDARPLYPAGLTVREVEVLCLVVAGLTNAEIAERLFLSRGTVKIHLVHIYNKIGASNRAAAIRFATDHHLE